MDLGRSGDAAGCDSSVWKDFGLSCGVAGCEKMFSEGAWVATQLGVRAIV